MHNHCENCIKSYTLTPNLGFPAATDWVVSNEELTPANRYCIKNLTTGDLLHVRVVAVNPGGHSEPGKLAEPVPIREIVGEWQSVSFLKVDTTAV